MRNRLPFLSLFSLLIFSGTAVACDSCNCALSHSGHPLGDGRRVFADVTYERIDWNESDAATAHTFHHQGHDVHDKTHEDIVHLLLGFEPSKEVTLLAELPWVSRTSLDVEHHSRLGQRQVSEGLGDLKLSAIWRVWNDADGYAGPAVGIKLPTGNTRELDPLGGRFEPELQPGSGSTDVFGGIVFGREWGRVGVRGNAIYSENTKGSRDFTFGDLFSSSVDVAVRLTSDGAIHAVSAGVETKLDVAGKDSRAGEKDQDSGGATLWLGPAIEWEAGKRASVTASVVFPVLQDLGGLHQEADFITHVGGRVAW